MTDWAPLADAGYALATAALFAIVGWSAGRKDARGSDMLALSMFRAWWFGVSTFLVLGALMSILEWLDALTRAAGFAISVLSMLAVCAATWGLVFYVTYLYTGNTKAFLVSLVFYGVVFAGMVYALAADPTGAELEAWHESVVRLAILTGPLLSVVIVALLIPALAALGAYVGLYGRLHTRAQRFRLGLSTGSLMTWFGLAILAWVAGFADTLIWVYAGRVLALGAAGGVLLAYAPPRWLIERCRLVAEPVDA